VLFPELVRRLRANHDRQGSDDNNKEKCLRIELARTFEFPTQLPGQLYIQLADPLNQPVCQICHSESYMTHDNFKNAPAQPHSSYHFRNKVWNVVENETMEILSGDKVPLKDSKGATGGNCI